MASEYLFFFFSTGFPQLALLCTVLEPFRPQALLRRAGWEESSEAQSVLIAPLFLWLSENNLYLF